jgi:hypothetical protein
MLLRGRAELCVRTGALTGRQIAVEADSGWKEILLVL